MYKIWYVVEQQGEYYIGVCYGNEESPEQEIVEAMGQYCREKRYRLVLMAQITTLGIVNQIFPDRPTTESRNCLQSVLIAAESHPGVV